MSRAQSAALIALALTFQHTEVWAGDDEPSLALFTEALRATPRLSAKGRVQDPSYNPSVPINHLIAERPSESVDFLVELVASAEPLPQPVLDYWPTMTVGDLALTVALDLFLDSELHSTVSSLTWSQLLEAKGRSDSAFGQIQEFLEGHSRDELQERLRRAWQSTRERVRWDAQCTCFRQDSNAPAVVGSPTNRSWGWTSTATARSARRALWREPLSS